MNNDKIKMLEEALDNFTSEVALTMSDEKAIIESLQNQLAIEKGDGWLPIESAPKDGTEILVCEGGMVITCCWDSLDYDEFRRNHIMGWCYGCADVDPSNFQPTHWRPLPQPPKSEEK